MDSDPKGTDHVEGAREGGAERHPTDLLGSQGGGSQATGTEPAQPSGDTPPADKPATDSKPVGDNAEQGAKTVTDPELPEAVRRAVTDSTDGWADDENPEPDIMAPATSSNSRPSRQTDELNGDIKPSRRWWILVIWIIAGIAVSIFISLAVQNGEGEKTQPKKPTVAKVSAKSDKGKVVTTAPAKMSSFTVLARRDETLELYAKWVKASVDDVLKWNNIDKMRSLRFGSAVVLYATHENLISFEEERQKYNLDKRDKFNAKYFITGYQKVKVEYGALAALEAKYSAPAWLLDQINPRLNLDDLKIGDEVTVPRVVDRSTGQAPVADGIKVAVSGGVQPPTDIMTVDPNAPDAVSGASASATTVSPVEGNTVVTPVTVDGAIVSSGAVVGLAAGASEQAVAAEGTADEAVFRVSELEAKVAELQRKLDKAIATGTADTAKLRKEFEAAKAELDNALATAQPDPAAPSPPAPSTPPPVSTGSGATGSSTATHLLVDPAVYLRFCLKYGGTQEGCDRTLKDLQQ